MKHMGKTLGWLTLRLLEIVLKVDMHAKALLKHKGLKGIHKAEILPICSAREALRRRKGAKELQAAHCATLYHGIRGADAVLMIYPDS